MKRKILSTIIFLLMLTISADAAKDPNRVTTWNRFTDFFATVGKSDQEKKSALNERKRSRRQSRIFKNKQKQQKKMQKKMRKQNDAIMKDVTTRRVPHSRGGVDAR